MKVLSRDEQGAVIQVSWDEVAIMHYAIGEIVQKIDDWEFPILVGAPVESAKPSAFSWARYCSGDRE